MNPQEALQAGRQILDPVLLPAGFNYVAGEAGDSSGGPFARAVYAKDDRELELHFRRALMAAYRVGGKELSHNDYMKRKGVWAESQYARFSRDGPLDGFRALRADLEKFCAEFIRGSGEEIAQFVNNLN